MARVTTYTFAWPVCMAEKSCSPRSRKPRSKNRLPNLPLIEKANSHQETVKRSRLPTRTASR